MSHNKKKKKDEIDKRYIFSCVILSIFNRQVEDYLSKMCPVFKIYSNISYILIASCRVIRLRVESYILVSFFLYDQQSLMLLVSFLRVIDVVETKIQNNLTSVSQKELLKRDWGSDCHRDPASVIF